MASGSKTRQGRSTKSSAGSKGSSGGSKRSRGGGSGAKRARASGKRELIDTGRDKRYVRRDAQGQFKESDDVGRSLAADRRQHARTQSQPGQGDRGDRKR
jgi:hypothetical protein